MVPPPSKKRKVPKSGLDSMSKPLLKFQSICYNGTAGASPCPTIIAKFRHGSEHFIEV